MFEIIHILLFAVWIFIDVFFKNTIHQIIIPVSFLIINSISYKFKIFKEETLMALMHITKDNFETEVLSSGKIVLLDFYADWCVPCKMLSPVLEEVAQLRPDITVGKINVDEEMELAMEFKVASIPMLSARTGSISFPCLPRQMLPAPTITPICTPLSRHLRITPPTSRIKFVHIRQ